MNDDIFKIANQASLKILLIDKTIEVRHLVRLDNKSNWGVLFFFFGGIILIIIPLIKTSDISSKVLGITIGFLFLILSILTLIRQIADRLKINDEKISFRYNLKSASLPLNKNMKVKMKTEILKTRRVGTLGSDFIHVTHYLQHLNDEIPIFKFQMDNKDSDKAIKLGTQITRTIDAKLQQVN